MAISQKGLVLFINGAIKSAILKQLNAIHIPNPSPITTTVPDPLTMGSTEVTITISGGRFNQSHLSVNNVTQSSGGVFNVDAVLDGQIVFSNWFEEDKYVASPVAPPNISRFNASSFNITFHGISLKATIALSLDKQNNLFPSVTNITVNVGAFNYTLPSQSFVKSTTMLNCVQMQMNKEVAAQASLMSSSIATLLVTALTSVFTDITNSGALTNDIHFSFPGTPNGLQFPNNNNGAQYRVLGEVKYKGQPAVGNIGTVPFPPLPIGGHDVTFAIDNYEFNALLWAFHQQGSLNFTFDKTNIPFQLAMNTDYYTGTGLNAITQQYPHRDLIVDLQLSNPPVVVLQAGKAELTYTAIISFWIAKAGTTTQKETEIFTFDLTETDALERFSVSTGAGGVEVLSCRIGLVQAESVKVLNTIINPVDSKLLNTTWKSIFHPSYCNVLEKAIKQSGVPLPSLPQCSYTNFSVQVNSGYVSASVNFK